MKNFNGRELVLYVIIAVLLMIIFAMLVNKYDSTFSFLPNWFLESLFTGVFTLSGAAVGAYLAGRFTLRSVQEQMKHSEEQTEKARITNNNNALRIIDYVLEDFFAVFGFASGPFQRGNTDPATLKRAINEFNVFTEEIEKLLLDPQLLSHISEEHIEKIPGEIRRKTSHLKDIVRVVNLHAEKQNKKKVKDIYEDLNRVLEGLHEVRKNIEEIVNR